MSSSDSKLVLENKFNDQSIRWIEFNKSEGQLLLVFEYLIINRCDIKEVRYGVNGSRPNNILVLPTCNGDIKKIETYRTLPPSTLSISVHLTLIDGEETNIREYYVE
ncbi:MAG: hypothetical protein P8K09_06970 [Hyphomicrobiales bacterium]|jgi:hypothetical protein|nr:hypothetical protein [Hyphomicrobiales bacterium]|tara:strand:+ start:160 stop:480 length:321 start_codon:yes stop_codon:yes gene_type:complete